MIHHSKYACGLFNSNLRFLTSTTYVEFNAAWSIEIFYFGNNRNVLRR